MGARMDAVAWDLFANIAPYMPLSPRVGGIDDDGAPEPAAADYGAPDPAAAHAAEIAARRPRARTPTPSETGRAPRCGALGVRRRAPYDHATLACVAFHATSVSGDSRARARADPNGPGLRGLAVHFHARRVGSSAARAELVEMTVRRLLAVRGVYLARALEYMHELVGARTVALAEFPPALRAAYAAEYGAGA